MCKNFLFEKLAISWFTSLLVFLYSSILGCSRPLCSTQKAVFKLIFPIEVILLYHGTLSSPDFGFIDSHEGLGALGPRYRCYNALLRSDQSKGQVL